MQKTLGKRLTASLLSAIMLFALLPTAALASGGVVALDEVRQYLEISSNRFDTAFGQNKALEVSVCDTLGNQLAKGKTDVYVDGVKDLTPFHGYDISVNLSVVNPAAYEIISVSGNGVASFQNNVATIHYKYLVEAKEDCKQLVITVEQRSYEIAFQNEDGTPYGSSQHILYGAQASTPTPAPQKDGHTFQGWYAEGATAAFEFTTPITTGLTLTAKWAEIPPVVPTTWDAWFFIRTDGLVPMETGSTNYPSGQYLPLHGQAGALTGTIKRESAWTTNYGELVGDTLNGERLSDAFAEVQDAIATPPSPESIAKALTDVKFNPKTQGVMWYVVKSMTDDTCPGYHVDGVLYTKGEDPAQVRVINYLSNIPDGREQLLAYSVHGLDTTAIVGNLLPTRTGYDFIGWNTKADGSGTHHDAGGKLKMNTDHTLYAQWALKTTKVEIWHYYIDGAPSGSPIKDTAAAERNFGAGGVTSQENTQITKEYVDAMATLALYENGRHIEYQSFTLWAYPDDGSASVKVLPGSNGYVDLTGVKELRIHLEYYPTGYTVIYNANGGATADGKNTIEKHYNTATGYTILPNAGDKNPNFTRGDHTFAGWTKDAPGTEEVTAGTPGTALPTGQSITYYAQWLKNEGPTPTTYTVTYQYTGTLPPGMTPPTDDKQYLAQAAVALATAPTAPVHYTFTGWTLPEGLTDQGGTFTMPAGNVTVTGAWTYTPPSGGGDPTPSRHTVTVNYLAEGTNTVLSAPYVSTRLTYGSRYDVTEQTGLTIDGYTRSSVDGAPTGTLRKNEAITVYYTANPDIPEETPPLTPGPGDNSEIEIPDTAPPATSAPDTGEDSNGGSPGSSTEKDEIIVAENAPLGNLPQTGTTAQGVDPTATLGLIALAASLAAAGLGIALGRKKEENA